MGNLRRAVSSYSSPVMCKEIWETTNIQDIESEMSSPIPGKQHGLRSNAFRNDPASWVSVGGSGDQVPVRSRDRITVSWRAVFPSRFMHDTSIYDMSSCAIQSWLPSIIYKDSIMTITRLRSA